MRLADKPCHYWFGTHTYSQFKIQFIFFTKSINMRTKMMTKLESIILGSVTIDNNKDG